MLLESPSAALWSVVVVASAAPEELAVCVGVAVVPLDEFALLDPGEAVEFEKAIRFEVKMLSAASWVSTLAFEPYFSLYHGPSHRSDSPPVQVIAAADAEPWSKGRILDMV